MTEGTAKFLSVVVSFAILWGIWQAFAFVAYRQQLANLHVDGSGVVFMMTSQMPSIPMSDDIVLNVFEEREGIAGPAFPVGSVRAGAPLHLPYVGRHVYRVELGEDHSNWRRIEVESRAESVSIVQLTVDLDSARNYQLNDAHLLVEPPAPPTPPFIVRYTRPILLALAVPLVGALLFFGSMLVWEQWLEPMWDVRPSKLTARIAALRADNQGIFSDSVEEGSARSAPYEGHEDFEGSESQSYSRYRTVGRGKLLWSERQPGGRIVFLYLLSTPQQSCDFARAIRTVRQSGGGWSSDVRSSTAVEFCPLSAFDLETLERIRSSLEIIALESA